MSIKNRCVACDFVIEAPDAMRGQEVVCPKCEAVNLLRTADEARLQAAQVELERTREKERFLERLGQAGDRPPAGPGAPGGRDDLGDLDLGLAALAGQRLKDVADYLLVFAYVVLGLALSLSGVVVLLAELELAWKVFGFLAAALVGLFLFLFLKFMSDATRALADLSDLARAIDRRLAQHLEPSRDRGPG